MLEGLGSGSTSAPNSSFWEVISHHSSLCLFAIHMGDSGGFLGCQLQPEPAMALANIEGMQQKTSVCLSALQLNKNR